MLHLKAQLLALACTLGAAVACSQSSAKSASASTSDSSAASAADASDDAPQSTLDCTKVFTSADAVGILNEPAKVSNYTPRPGSCRFDTAKESGSITVYGGSDMTSEMTWNDVTKSVDSLKYVALPGVGDRAVRKASDGTEIDSKKGKVYCSILLSGIGQYGTNGEFTKSRGEELAKKLGALCNKYFAAQ